MKKQTLKFNCLVTMARFSKMVPVGYLMNTNNCTLTAKFDDKEIELALKKYEAVVIATTEKIFSYETV